MVWKDMKAKGGLLVMWKGKWGEGGRIIKLNGVIIIKVH
jgi:hypothetical protein